MFQNLSSSQDAGEEKNDLLTLLQLRAAALQEELQRARAVRINLEQEKMFWKKREEEFRAECYRVKRHSGRKQNQGGHNMTAEMMVEDLDELTRRALKKAEKLLPKWSRS